MKFFLIIFLLISSHNSIGQDSDSLKQHLAVEYIKQAQKKIEIGEYDDAIYVLKKALENDSKNGFANFYLYHAYFNKGMFQAEMANYQDAIIQYSYAIKYMSFDIVKDFEYLSYEAYYNRGVCKAKLNKFSSAINDYNKSLELNPNDKLAYFNRAVAKHNLKDYNGACADYNKAYQLGYNVSKAILSVCN